jgi:hypothetical protein
MRKVLIILLALAAIGIYSWDALLVVRPSSEKRISIGKHADLSLDKLLAGSQPVHFVKKGRSPFLPFPVEEKTVLLKPSSGPVVAPRAAIKPPDVKVSGIIWNPSAPLAMITLPDGSSAVAKAGQAFGEITVKKIEKTRMLISFHQADFWITW